MLQEGSEEAVFTLKEGWDTEWLDTALEADPELEAGEAMASGQFLTEVCGARGFSRILYSKEHPILLPTVQYTLEHDRHCSQSICSLAPV